MKASPGPWRWEKTFLPFMNCDSGLRAADGTWVILSVGSDIIPKEPGDRGLIRLAPDMASMLREIEWRGNTEEGESRATCPSCECGKPEHGLGCRLAALLKDMEAGHGG